MSTPFKPVPLVQDTSSPIRARIAHYLRHVAPTPSKLKDTETAVQVATHILTTWKVDCEIAASFMAEFWNFQGYDFLSSSKEAYRRLHPDTAPPLENVKPIPRNPDHGHIIPAIKNNFASWASGFEIGLKAGMAKTEIDFHSKNVGDFGSQFSDGLRKGYAVGAGMRMGGVL